VPTLGVVALALREIEGVEAEAAIVGKPVDVATRSTHSPMRYRFMNLPTPWVAGTFDDRGQDRALSSVCGPK
jgi:hypothetical protein